MAYTKTVTYAVAAAGVHTLTLSDVEDLYVGDTLRISGVSNDFNGDHAIETIDTTNLKVTYTQGNQNHTGITVTGQAIVLVKWCTEADIETWLGFEATSTFLDLCTEAANEYAFRKRQEAGYTDRAALVPNPSVKEGTIMYGAYLFRDRGSSGDAYAGFDGMGQFERPISMARVMQLLGTGRPQVG